MSDSEYQHALDLSNGIKAAVAEAAPAIRASLDKSWPDASWNVGGLRTLELFAALEISIDMLRECPDTTLVHFVGMTTTGCLSTILAVLGVPPGSEKHLAISSLLAKTLEGALNAGPQSIH